MNPMYNTYHVRVSAEGRAHEHSQFPWPLLVQKLGHRCQTFIH